MLLLPLFQASHKTRWSYRRHSKTYLILIFCFIIWLIYFNYSPISIFPPISYNFTYNFNPSLERTSQASIWAQRQHEVREAFLHAFTGYVDNAFPADELLSVSGLGVNKFNGWSVTLIDSMDTMWIMGLHAQFADAVSVVAMWNFTMKPDSYAPFFETVIRYLGGLLSAYALSKEPILLMRADDLGRMLLPAFEGTPSGFPAYGVNTQTGRTAQGWMGNLILFSEATSCQLEFKYLTKLTGRRKYYVAVDHIMNKIYAANVSNGLFPTTWSDKGSPIGEHISVGTSADSGIEYLLKQWLLSGDTKALKQYIKSITGIITHLLYITPMRDLLYVTDLRPFPIDNTNITLTTPPKPTHTQSHLACFLPALLALGAHTLPESILPSKTRELHRWAAQGLAYTCYVMYRDQATGLAPDQVKMSGDGAQRWVDRVEEWKATGKVGGVPPGLGEREKRGTRKAEREYVNTEPTYLLRPETIESFYILWRTTGDTKWRERGYEIFHAIQKFTRTKYGYASIRGVDDAFPKKIDDMPSYFLAETLKYLYLLFDDGDDPYPLDKWVFNTEGHPFPIFKWTDAEKIKYGI